MEFVLVAGFIVLVLVIHHIKEGRLNDPNRYDTIYTEGIPNACKIKDGPVSAALFRQSGNLYRDLGFFPSKEAAINEILKSLKRAKIDAVYVKESSQERFEVLRLHHSHRGKAEGKKLGGAVVASEKASPNSSSNT